MKAIEKVNRKHTSAEYNISYLCNFEISMHLNIDVKNSLFFTIVCL